MWVCISLMMLAEGTYSTFLCFKHQANPLLSMKNYTGTPFVISRNDKNKQQTLLSQRKLSLTAINKLFSL